MLQVRYILEVPKVSEQKTKALPAIRVPIPLFQWVQEQAVAEGMNVSEFVRYLLTSAKRREK